MAILDTGVDIYHDDLNELWTDSRIFYQNFAPGGASEKVPQDDHGHGTHVTSILMSIAEYVNVYVARVSSKGYDWDSALVEKVCNASSIAGSPYNFPPANLSIYINTLQ